MRSRSGQGDWLDEANYWSTPIMANLLWVALSVPIVTLPLAVVGLLGVMFRWMVNDSTQVFSIFFITIRRTWLKCYVIALVDVAICGFLYMNLSIFQVMDMTNVLAFMSRSVTLFVAIVFLCVNVYVWTLLSVWDVPLKLVVKTSIQLVFAQPIWTVGIALAVVLPLVFSTTYVPRFVLITFIGALIGYFASKGTWFILRKYLSADQFKWIDLT
jgi:uncharacterized membrane protein YesL